MFLLVSPTLAHAVCISGDCKNGFGIFSWANGDEHESDFRNGQANGEELGGIRMEISMLGNIKTKKTWTWNHFWRNGDKFVGEYNYGKRNGPGIKTYANGTRWIGDWLKDKRVWQPNKDCVKLT